MGAAAAAAGEPRACGGRSPAPACMEAPSSAACPCASRRSPLACAYAAADSRGGAAAFPSVAACVAQCMTHPLAGAKGQSAMHARRCQRCTGLVQVVPGAGAGTRRVQAATACCAQQAPARHAHGTADRPRRARVPARRLRGPGSPPPRLRLRPGRRPRSAAAAQRPPRGLPARAAAGRAAGPLSVDTLHRALASAPTPGPIGPAAAGAWPGPSRGAGPRPPAPRPAGRRPARRPPCPPLLHPRRPPLLSVRAQTRQPPRPPRHRRTCTPGGRSPPRGRRRRPPRRPMKRRRRSRPWPAAARRACCLRSAAARASPRWRRPQPPPRSRSAAPSAGPRTARRPRRAPTPGRGARPRFPAAAPPLLRRLAQE